MEEVQKCHEALSWLGDWNDGPFHERTICFFDRNEGNESYGTFLRRLATTVGVASDRAKNEPKTAAALYDASAEGTLGDYAGFQALFFYRNQVHMCY